MVMVKNEEKTFLFIKKNIEIEWDLEDNKIL